MNNWRIVDLSHVLIPEQEEYGLKIQTFQVDELLPKYRRKPGDWYIMSKIELSSHCGTHVEAPYHHFKEGDDIASLPLDKFIGEAVIIDLTEFGNNARIGLDHLKRKAQDRLRPGDIVFFRCGGSRFYGTEKQHHRPWFAPDAIEWLVEEAKVKCVGVDTSGIEVRDATGEPTDDQPNHKMLLSHGVPLIEYLANLDQVKSDRFMAIVLPVKIKGAESFPARVIAMEDVE